MDWKGLIWKIYFFLLIIMLTIGAILTKSWKVFYIIDGIIAIGSLLALFLLSFRIKLFKPLIWKTYFFIYVSWGIIFDFIIYPSISKPHPIAPYIFYFIIIFPLYLGLYFYAFRFLEK